MHDTLATMTPQDISRSIAEPTGLLGAAFYFHPDTLAKGKSVGLGGFQFYVLGRGGVLGDVEPTVVHSAFGYFNPDRIASLWNSAREAMAPRDAARLYLECAYQFARTKLTDTASLGAYVEAASTVVAAVDDSAMALFAGLRAEPVPSDLPAAAYHYAILLRELRGSAHLVAVTSVGLPTKLAHAIKRPEVMAVFGWDETPPETTDDQRARLLEAENVTERILANAFGELSPAQASALIAGTTAMRSAILG
jgi:hypothetical protein